MKTGTLKRWAHGKTGWIVPDDDPEGRVLVVRDSFRRGTLMPPKLGAPCRFNVAHSNKGTMAKDVEITMTEAEQIADLEHRRARARERLCRLETRLDSWESACRSDPALEPLRQEVAQAANDLAEIERRLEAARSGEPKIGGAAINAGFTMAISPLVRSAG